MVKGDYIDRRYSTLLFPVGSFIVKATQSEKRTKITNKIKRPFTVHIYTCEVDVVQNEMLIIP